MVDFKKEKYIESETKQMGGNQINSFQLLIFYVP